MVSFDSRGKVNQVIVPLLIQFPQEAIYFTPLSSSFLPSTRIMMLDMLTS